MPVPLDRTGAVPGSIALSVERRPATAGTSGVAVVALAGGPGQATLPLARFIAEAMSPALTTRDLLVFDPRGTGASGPLSCPALGAAEIATAHSLGEVIQRCARQLGPARGAYTTRESVEDIEAVRQAAGYEKLVLYGTSYGTKVALEYARRYPQHVASLVLDSTETPDGPEPFHVDTFKAMRPMLRELCSTHACDAVSRTPLSDLARLVAESSLRPLTGNAYDGQGKRIKRSITSRSLFEVLLAGDLNPATRAEVPAAVHAALGHDLGPLARVLTIAATHPPHEESAGANDETLFIATSCEETPFPWQRGAPEATRAVEAEAALNSLPGSDFYPFDAESALLDMTIPLCVGWPDASTPSPGGGPLPDVPTLILSGGQDLRTPTADAQRVAAMIPGSQLVRVPYTGHSVIGSDLSGCARSAVADFFAGSAVKPCVGTVDRFPPAPRAPSGISALAPARGLRGPQGRTVTAAVGSILDARRTVLELALDFGEVPVGVAFGGLRGGSVRVTKAGAQLDRFAYVPGVKISGLIPTSLLLRNSGAAAQLSVSGSAATAGRLRVQAGGRISGVLGGRSFHADVSAKVKVARAGSQGAAASRPLPDGVIGFPLPGLARLR
ncbi:MAG: alpha/beta hydrolase [Solirubrobacterales bacterium]|nr:alpha/beta hydrolase [Solirubrobacterales bacterium]MCW3026278.1 alpha/beta hydrolase [Solirubrobacterales bacterium]